ncbi:hypothetical protein [Moheibacter lacus]|uniref:Uncharacterized protein n=1 Tax=Moheibacter lacus TaxID=2745851 RepID=A0A838ZT09_9FLAO|nr:hypothetical protein [Moheibacter lacus]MBA5630116.1 hypothetical protein [Moheibacter lacus]
MKKLKFKSKIFLSSFVIFAGYYLYSYHSENKKYEILNEIFSDLNYNYDYICINKTYVYSHTEQFNQFSLIDKPSVYFQYWIQNFFESFSDFRNWKINKIKPKKIKYSNENGEKHFSKILNKCDFEWEDETGDGLVQKNTKITPSNVAISMPILSSDGNTAIIQIDINCGVLCGSGNTLLFKKINGKWKLIDQNMSWIS